ncbi:hypothetical protein C5Y97_05645 [Blastopirellula marina]|uniref:Uncharacterized protein n=1 Tax=Blastopirellula marina TaxID=124 RepID=A0A2S8G8B6_9BACT|nr:hypothetical protein C5Y98_05645 [Blastopirellula marina]PTL45662.1 hypothetical protein C5Y97_05645 [Blastopirellula marina]
MLVVVFLLWWVASPSAKEDEMEGAFQKDEVALDSDLNSGKFARSFRHDRDRSIGHPVFGREVSSPFRLAKFGMSHKRVPRQPSGPLAVRLGAVELSRNYGKSENYKLWGGLGP